MHSLSLTAALLSITGFVAAVPLKPDAGHGGEKNFDDYGVGLNRYDGKNWDEKPGKDNPNFREILPENRYGVNKYNTDEWKDKKNDHDHDHEKRDLSGLGGGWNRFEERGHDFFRGGKGGGWTRFRGRGRWSRDGIGRRNALPMGDGGDRGIEPWGYGGLGKADWGGGEGLRDYGDDHGQPSRYRKDDEDEYDDHEDDHEKNDRKGDDREDEEEGEDEEDEEEEEKEEEKQEDDENDDHDKSLDDGRYGTSNSEGHDDRGE